MNIIVDSQGFPVASFQDATKARALFDALPDVLKVKYTLIDKNFVYPYFFIWTWDRADSRNEQKWEVKLTDGTAVDEYVKTIQRDKAYENGDEYEQYFYLGIVNKDGIGYAICKEMKEWLAEKANDGTDEITCGECEQLTTVGQCIVRNEVYVCPRCRGLCLPEERYPFAVFDHEHIFWALIAQIRSMGFQRFYMRRWERRKFVKNRNKRRERNRLHNLEKRGVLSDKVIRKLRRLEHHVQRYPKHKRWTK